MLFTDNYSEQEEGSHKRAGPFVLESDPHDEELSNKNPSVVTASQAAPAKPIVTLKISAAPTKSLVQASKLTISHEEDDYENYEEDFDEEEEEEMANFQKTAQEFQEKLRVLTELSKQPMPA